jgi:hypothetical protein
MRQLGDAAPCHKETLNKLQHSPSSTINKSTQQIRAQPILSFKLHT